MWATTRQAVVSSVAIALVYLGILQSAIYPVYERAGHLTPPYTSVADGQAPAPFQYRVLVPLVGTWLFRHAGLSPEKWVFVLTAISFLSGVGLLGVAARRRGTLGQFPVVMLIVVLCGLGVAYSTSPETFPAFAAVALIVLGLRRQSDGDVLAFTVGVALLLLMRPEIPAALGVGYLAVAAFTRDRKDLWAGSFSLAAALAALVAAKLIYPDARYLKTLPMNQLGHNLTSWKTGLGVLVIVPLAVPLWRKVTDRTADDWAAAAGFVIGFAIFVAATFVVGRPGEIRLWLPFVGGLAVLSLPTSVDAGAGSGDDANFDRCRDDAAAATGP